MDADVVPGDRTPAELVAACEEIRRAWSPLEHYRRRIDYANAPAPAARVARAGVARVAAAARPSPERRRPQPDRAAMNDAPRPQPRAALAKVCRGTLLLTQSLRVAPSR